MSATTDRIKEQLHELEQRIKVAINDHEAAKSAFGRLEVPPSHPMWGVFRDRIDSTLIHQRVLQALWHRTKAELLERMNADKEPE
ncbi:hypothetical protein CHF33_01 [Pseudomonas phage CHF33]|uniref:Uncharacterized protein n=2 Tax=Ghunavirus TaxID=2732683 RepID=A0A7D0TPA4_9CAUD|nr:hypothetical protein CHF1_01 [Pseudomonas phage CHF1]QHB48061.1 hypothetical protein CHF33_01 [Pseudomonas phage CHF33]